MEKTAVQLALHFNNRGYPFLNKLFYYPKIIVLLH